MPYRLSRSDHHWSPLLGRLLVRRWVDPRRRGTLPRRVGVTTLSRRVCSTWILSDKFTRLTMGNLVTLAR